MRDASDRTTTGQNTHRHLRLSLVFVVFALLSAVLVQTVVASWDPFALGWNPLPSVSHYFYTPARSVFVGTLVAASLALLALSGRDCATTLLDISAIFAPLIALVPTGIDPEHPIGGASCSGDRACVPASDLIDVQFGVALYSIVVICVVITMAAIRRRRGTTAPRARIVSSIAVLTALALAALAFLPGLNEGFPFNFWPFPRSIHFLVTLLFFGGFAAVPILHSRGRVVPGETPPTDRQRKIYHWEGVLMIADLVMLIVAVALGDALGGFPFVLLGETAGLVLFATFWWMQTFQRWDDANPPSLALEN